MQDLHRAAGAQPITSHRSLEVLAPRPLRDTASRVSGFPESLHFLAKLCRCDACRGLGAFPLDGVQEKIQTSAAMHKGRERNPCLLERAAGLQARQGMESCA